MQTLYTPTYTYAPLYIVHAYTLIYMIEKWLNNAWLGYLIKMLDNVIN